MPSERHVYKQEAGVLLQWSVMTTVFNKALLW